MKFSRRRFIGSTAGATAFSLASPVLAREQQRKSKAPLASDHALEQAASKLVLQLKGLNEPIIIESIELLRKDREHFVRVRCRDGSEGVSVDNGRMGILQPILTRLVIPYFLGKD